MNVIHTSDWHLGKKLFKVSRLDEQKLFLDWLLEIIKKETVAILIIAGDIYDTPSPPADAVRLFYNFLHRLSAETDCHCYIVAGNHDSGAFIEAPKNLLQDKNIEIVGKLSGDTLPTVTHQNVEFQFLPFFRSYEILQIAKTMNLSINEGEDESDLILKTIGQMMQRKSENNSAHRLLMAHHIFGNMDKVEMGGSEQVISLSGLDSIPNSLLEKNYDYVALGHIHKKATLNKDTPIIRYSGAPLPFRFSENYKKSITLLTLEKKITYTEIDVPSFRELISIRTNSEQINSEIDALKERLSSYDFILTPLLEVQLTSKDPQTGMADKIREELKDFNIELLSFRTIIEGVNEEDEEELILKGLPEISKLFQMFYFSKYPSSSEVPKEITDEFKQLLSEIHDSAEGEQ